MNLDQARRVVKERKPGAEGYVHHATACAVIYANHMTTRHGDAHFTTDAVRPTATEGVKPVRTQATTVDAAIRDSIDMLDQILVHVGGKPTKDANREPDWAKALDRAQNPTRDAIQPEYSTTSTPMGKLENAGPVGGELVMTLPGHLGMYYVAKTDSGEVELFRHGTAEGALKGVSTGPTQDQFMAFGRKSEKREQTAMKSIASTVRSFWEKQRAA